jgi:hypothetical protein
VEVGAGACRGMDWWAAINSVRRPVQPAMLDAVIDNVNVCTGDLVVVKPVTTKHALCQMFDNIC